ncbi:MAG: ORF6N domain-containing protein [Pseudomonadota bacterium]
MKNSDNKITVYGSSQIQKKIFTIRNEQVIVDRDLAELYQVPTKRLNEQVKRNIERFPDTFRFQLDDNEKIELVANCDRFENLKHSSVNPYVFTEQGVAMLSAVLKSEIAVAVSIQIINAFVAMRKFLVTNAGVFQRLDKLEIKQIETDQKFEKVFNALQKKDYEPKQGIFFDGQIFDAYKFVSSLIRKAEKTILLIDNYIDETVLDLFTKKKKDVSVTILTANLNKSLTLDGKKFNKQYPRITIKEFNKAHDRFLIVDDSVVYHFGASLKDLGNKWFAFSKMDKSVLELLENLKKVDADD